MRALPTTCIIGAGSSGIATCKVLHERGLPFDCYELGDRVGGNWVYRNKNGMSACYRGLHINTSKTLMQYSDFPMPEAYPAFPHHSQIAAYFDRYVDRFGFRAKIRFETPVRRAARAPDGTWEVTLGDGTARRYDALAVANGHHWDPRWPDPPFPGAFAGVQMHSHGYDAPDALRDKRVVVLGMGNSAMDIAVEASDVAKRTFLAARRGAWVLPKFLWGKPADRFLGILPWVPFGVRRRFAEAVYALSVGDVTAFGLPRPDHRLGEAHPTISGRILDRIGHGAVTVKPTITRLEGDRVRFADDTVEDVDVIIYCTGYRVTFPFFAPEFLAAKDNDLPLFRRVFHPDHDDLFFVGLLQPWGAIMPLAEAQSAWIADYLQGRYALPDRAAMLRDMAEERARNARRYVASARHTMQVDADTYLFDLARERKRGARRARERGYAPPVPAVAATLAAP